MINGSGDSARLAEPARVPRRAVEAMHADQVRRHGGSVGLRDAGLLESALARPQQRHPYDSNAADLADLAAAYCVGLAKNHAFADGNKRTAFQTMFTFLRMNGLLLLAPEPEVVTLMLDIATGVLDDTALAAWVRAHTSKVTRR